MNTIFHPTANCQNTNCLTQGVHPTNPSSPRLSHARRNPLKSLTQTHFPDLQRISPPLAQATNRAENRSASGNRAMRKVKNITVCVTPEIYRQARHLAAEYDTTVSTIVAWLLPRLPAALERTRFPKGGPKPLAQRAQAPTALPTAASPTPTLKGTSTPAPTPSTPRIAISGCETAMPHQTNAVSTAYGDQADAVTAPAQLYSAVKQHINKWLHPRRQNAVFSL